MAKELFLNQMLTEQMIQVGDELIKRLDESNAKLHAAFWVLEPEETSWKLIVASPLVREEDPRKYYQRIINANECAGPDEYIISTHDIEAANMEHRVVKAVLGYYSAKVGLDGTYIINTRFKKLNLDSAELYAVNSRFGRSFFRGVFVEDIYIYRIVLGSRNLTIHMQNTNPQSFTKNAKNDGPINPIQS